MRTVVIGATDLARAVASMLLELADVELVGCVGAPATIRASYAPAGRQNTRHADLSAFCEALGLRHHMFSANDALVADVADWGADAAIVAGWYHLIPRSVRACFPMGVFGLHASLLPAFRGGAPLSWAILAGASETGISLFTLTDGVDEGPLLGQERVPIGPRTTVGDLVRDTTEAGLSLIRRCLPAYSRGEVTPTEQDGEPSYCLHRYPEDGIIDWTADAADIDRLVRAVTHPYPGARTSLDGQPVLVWSAELPVDAPRVWSVPGGILRLPAYEDPLVVAGQGSVLLRQATDSSGVDLMPTLRRSSYKRFG